MIFIWTLCLIWCSSLFQMSLSASHSRRHGAKVSSSLLQNGFVYSRNGRERPLHQEWLPLCLCSWIPWPAQPRLWYQVCRLMSMFLGFFYLLRSTLYLHLSCCSERFYFNFFGVLFSTGKCRWWSLKEVQEQQRVLVEMGSRDKQRAQPSSRKSWVKNHAGKVKVFYAQVECFV